MAISVLKVIVIVLSGGVALTTLMMVQLGFPTIV
jgi:hypothetical protein